MKTPTKLFIALLVLSFVATIKISAQEDNSSTMAVKDEKSFQTLVIEGRITDDNDKGIKEIQVELFEDNQVVNSFETKANGKFKFELLNNRIYTIQLKKDGYVTKRISVNTRVPNDDPNVYAFDFDIGLVPVEGNAIQDETLYEYPSAIIQFDEKKKSFYFDKDYTKQLREDIQTSTIR